MRHERSSSALQYSPTQHETNMHVLDDDVDGIFEMRYLIDRLGDRRNCDELANEVATWTPHEQRGIDKDALQIGVTRAIIMRRRARCFCWYLHCCVWGWKGSSLWSERVPQGVWELAQCYMDGFRRLDRVALRL